MKSKTQHPFFVYGTLLPGQPNAFLWLDEAEWQAVAWLRNGRLYTLGAFPMLLEEGEEMVRGVVFAIRPALYEEVVARLDHLEGYDPAQPNASAYRRVQRDVLIDEVGEGGNGRSLLAWVYVGHPAAAPYMEPIPGGDWLRFTAESLTALDDWWQDVPTVRDLLLPGSFG